jgi:TPP-dependent 2-oxoacid decarboxylase
VHHTLGNGEFDLFRKMAEHVICTSAIMTPQKVAYETERLIADALHHRRQRKMRNSVRVSGRISGRANARQADEFRREHVTFQE